MCDPRLIRVMQPGETLKDDKVAGLHIRCNKTNKVWMLLYRTKQGVQRRPKLGTWPSMSPESARRAAKDLLEQVAAGKDPSAEWKKERAAPTMDDLWERWRKDRGLTKKSAWRDERNWQKYAQPYFGNRKVSSISYDDIKGLHASMGKTPYMANRVLALLSTMLHFAYRPMKWIECVPTEGVQHYPEPKRRRYMTNEEAAKIATILEREKKTNPESVAFIQLLIFTGARKAEIADARWENFDGDTIQLADSKTGRKVVHVPAQALELLRGLRKKTGSLTGIVSPVKLWEKIRKEAGCPDLRLHDCRHSFASAAISAGLDLAAIGELLGHSSPQTTARYAHLVDEAAKVAVTKTADVIERMMTVR